MALLGYRAYARHRGVALRAVQVAIQSGRIQATVTKTGKKVIDSDQADKDWDAKTDISKAHQSKSKKKPVSDYHDSRSMRERYEARLAKIEYEKEIGRLVDIDKVRRSTFETARKVRDAMLNIPNRISNELASETDPVKLHTMLTFAINQALEELARKERQELAAQEAEQENMGDEFSDANPEDAE